MHGITLFRGIAITSFAAALGIMLGLPGAATAATVRVHSYSATAVCEAPLPTYDATLRKRPLGIANEGLATIFISCSLPSDVVGDTATSTVFVYFQSMGSGGTVSCNLVAGSRPYGTSSVGGTAVIAAGSAGYLQWSNVNKVSAYGSFNFSCNLPRNIEMNLITVMQQDAGNEL